jgi:FkbM family methyltransferase
MKIFRRTKTFFSKRIAEMEMTVCRKIEEMETTVCRKMALITNDNIWTLPMGIQICVPDYPWDMHISRTIVNTNSFFEQEILDDLRKYIPKNAFILDIGANIGNHSLYWAGICAARVIHSFEPVPSIYATLIKNIQINKFDKVIIAHNIGLGDKKSAAELDRVIAYDVGGTSIKESEEYNYHMRIERLDDIDLQTDKIDFCKIDVEGFELKTLAGARKTLEKYKPLIFIESFNDKITKTKQFLAESGYREAIPFPHENYLFIPKT